MTLREMLGATRAMTEPSTEWTDVERITLARELAASGMEQLRTRSMISGGDGPVDSAYRLFQRIHLVLTMSAWFLNDNRRKILGTE